MSKKQAHSSHSPHSPHSPIARARVSAKPKPFPDDSHILTSPQREIPNPAAALADAAMATQPSERAKLRAATVCQTQREARARREALAILEREDARRDTLSRAEIPAAPTVREDLQATRRRPLDAPMATYPDPIGPLVWEPKWDGFDPDPLPSWVDGRRAITLLLIVASFIAGVVTGRLA